MAKKALIEYALNIRQSFRAFGISETCYRYEAKLSDENAEIADWLIRSTQWQRNWGFVPATDAEAKKMAADLQLILDKELSFFAEIDGQPVAICVCLPNLNEVIFDFHGKLSPVNVGKLIWRLKIRRPKSARLMLLGVRTELRGKKRYAPLATAVIAELVRRGLKRGYEWAELGWTLEDNRLINAAIQSMGAHIYKRYRLFEKTIGA